MSGYPIELVGGHPALDFLNTIHDWTVPEPRDHLPHFRDALRFGVAAGVLSRDEARRLERRRAGGELARLRELRGRLERVCRALVAGKAPPPDDLEALARDTAQAAQVSRPLRRGRRLEWVIAEDAGPAALRWRLLTAAVGLLRSPRMERVSACPSCGWFFLDTSKNRSRRWCSMATCGNSAKARAYYRRHRS